MCMRKYERLSNEVVLDSRFLTHFLTAGLVDQGFFFNLMCNAIQFLSHNYIAILISHYQSIFISFLEEKYKAALQTISHL
jgi:hypothetical protein